MRWLNSRLLEMEEQAVREGRNLDEQPIDWDADVRREFITKYVGPESTELRLGELSRAVGREGRRRQGQVHCSLAERARGPVRQDRSSHRRTHGGGRQPQRAAARAEVQGDHPQEPAADVRTHRDELQARPADVAARVEGRVRARVGSLRGAGRLQVDSCSVGGQRQLRPLRWARTGPAPWPWRLDVGWSAGSQGDRQRHVGGRHQRGRRGLHHGGRAGHAAGRSVGQRPARRQRRQQRWQQRRQQRRRWWTRTWHGADGGAAEAVRRRQVLHVQAAGPSGVGLHVVPLHSRPPASQTSRPASSGDTESARSHSLHPVPHPQQQLDDERPAGDRGGRGRGGAAGGRGERAGRPQQHDRGARADRRSALCRHADRHGRVRLLRAARLRGAHGHAAGAAGSDEDRRAGRTGEKYWPRTRCRPAVCAYTAARRLASCW